MSVYQVFSSVLETREVRRYDTRRAVSSADSEEERGGMFDKPLM